MIRPESHKRIYLALNPDLKASEAEMRPSDAGRPGRQARPLHMLYRIFYERRKLAVSCSEKRAAVHMGGRKPVIIRPCSELRIYWLSMYTAP